MTVKSFITLAPASAPGNGRGKIMRKIEKSVGILFMGKV
jgi:hypothetical protein